MKLQRSAIAPETIVAHVAANVHCNRNIEDNLELNLALNKNLKEEKCISLLRQINDTKVGKPYEGITTTKGKSITTANEGPGPCSLSW